MVEVGRGVKAPTPTHNTKMTNIDFADLIWRNMNNRDIALQGEYPPVAKFGNEYGTPRENPFEIKVKPEKKDYFISVID